MSDQATVLGMLYAVGMQAFMFTQHADRFYSGKVLCAYRPDLRHGEIVKVKMPDDYLRGPVLTAYAEGVESSVEVTDDGTIKRRTTVTFSRGLFDEAER